jgi:hypothetical protein
VNIFDYNIVVMDAEIKNHIGRNGIGWKDYNKMGISVASTYNFKTRDYSVFMGDNLNLLPQVLRSADLVVGYNIEDFDIPLIENTPEAECSEPLNLKTYDMLKELRNTNEKPLRGGLALGNVLVATFGDTFGKTEDGAEAPEMWQQQKLGRLITYSIADVTREAWLFSQIWHQKYVVSPKWGQLAPRPPQNLLVNVA